MVAFCGVEELAARAGMATLTIVVPEADVDDWFMRTPVTVLGELPAPVLANDQLMVSVLPGSTELLLSVMFCGTRLGNCVTVTANAGECWKSSAVLVWLMGLLATLSAMTQM